MSHKIITLDSLFPTGEATVQLVATLGRDGRTLRENTSLTRSKTASQSPALDYIRSVEPEPGKTIVLVIGLGDHETYGPNRNGDGFPSEPVKGAITPDQVLTKHFKSYENAHVFEHHINNDPAKAIGKVRKAFWNPYMRRVEVLEDFDHEKAPHLLEQIGDGEFPSKSMGCSPAGALVHTPQGRKKIEDIEVGDTVVTHTGACKPVTELHRRYYTGNMHTVYTSNGQSTVTSEHPYAVLPREVVEEWHAPRGYWRRRPVEDIDLTHVHWVPAQDLEAGMYVLTPFDTTVVDTLTVDECRLLGYYAAEGCLSRGTSSVVAFTHNINDVFVDELPDLLVRLGVATWQQRPHQNSDLALNTTAVSEELFNLCDKHVGRRALDKRLSLELMQQPREQQLAFLGAVINGDGGVDSVDDFYIATGNAELAHQYQHMGYRCGLYSRVQKIAHKPSTIVTRSTVEYRVSFSRRGCNIIAPYSKVEPRDLRAPSTGALLGERVIISKVTDVAVAPFEGPVYNFEVADDNSYVVGNHAMHNCRIPYDVCTVCLNKAPTRKEYCTHLLFEMSVIRPDGTQVCALNPAPNFFDSSWVKRPADRTGFMLKKVAYEIRTGGYELAEQVDALRDKAAALGKAADIEKVVTGEPVASASGGDDGTLRLVRNLVEHGGKTAPPARLDVTITTNYPPGEAIGTADALGLPMGLKDLIRYFMSRLGVTPSEASLDCGCKHASAVYELFAEYPDFYDEVVKAAGLLELSTSEKLAAQIADARISDTPMGRPLVRGPWSTETPNTDVLTFTDAQGRTMRSNVGLARSATRALEPEARARKAAVGAGYMGLGTLLGLGGSAAMLLGKRAPTRFLGGAATAAGLGLGAKGVHEVARPLRMGDLHGTQLMSNEGYIMPGLTEMKAASWHPEMAYVQLRLQDGKEACTPLPPQRKLAFMHAARAAEASDRTLNLEKIASILEKSIASLEI